jgi:hypothetical protein
VADPDGNHPLGQNDGLQVRKQRSKSRPFSTQRLSTTKSVSVLSPTVEENVKESEAGTHFELSRMREKSNVSSSSNKEIRPPSDDALIGKNSHTKDKLNGSSSSNKENRPTPDDALMGKESPPHSTPGSACSAPKVKSTTIHAQPIDSIKFMGPNLSLMTGIPMQTPKSLRIHIKETMGDFEKGKAAERVSRHSESPIGTERCNPATQPPRTLLKPLSSSPPPQSAFRMGPVAWAKKSLSRHSRASQDTIATPSNRGKPKVLVSKASTRDPEHEVPKDKRRLRGSDPGIGEKAPNRSPRKVSRSLYDDPQRKKKLLELDYAKRFPRQDPLSTISQEEDIASLSELAQALGFLEEQDGANSPSKHKLGSVKEEPLSNPPSGKHTVGSDWTSGAARPPLNSEHGNTAVQVGGAKISQRATNENTKVDEKDHCPSGLGPKFEATSSDPIGAYPLTPKRILASTNPVTPKPQTNQQRTPVRPSSSTLPCSPSTKFSALVAKFNNPDSQTTPERSPSRPPKKTITEFLAREDQNCVGSPKESLVAPYTTNPPSPTKSQKSGKSAITPQSRRSSLVASRKLLLDTALNLSRRTSLAGKDEMTIHAANSSPGGVPASKQSPPLSKLSPLGCRKTSCPLDTTSPTETNPPNSSNGDTECLFVTQTPFGEAVEEVQQQPISSAGCSTSPGHDEHVARCAMQIPASLQSPVSPEAVARSPSAVSTEVPKFDGPAGTIDLKKLPKTFSLREAELNCVKSSPSLVDRAGFVHPDSPFRDVFSSSRSVSPAGSPPLPGRSNSVLYAQIRTLRRQLAAKTEEVRQLKKQLEARGSLDIGTLSEQLRETKKETEHWKSRAEVAEKQVEMFTKLPLRPKSRQTSEELSAKSSRNRVLARSSTGYPGEAAEMAARIRKALHGMDGASSPPRWSSEESSDTVIREPIDGSERRVATEDILILYE